MPIQRYVDKGVVFAPETVSVMSVALEATAEILGIGSDEGKRRTVARFLIRAVQQDPTLDPDTLRDKAVVALGGVSYTTALRQS